MQGESGEGIRSYAEQDTCFYTRSSLISREEHNVMAHLETIAALVRLSATAHTIAYPAEGMRDHVRQA
jgi:hypothetical protein